MNTERTNTGINTDSFITGYSRTGKRPVRHLRIDDAEGLSRIYSVGEIIGKGTFGTVFEVRDAKDHKVWASKVIEKKQIPVANMKVLEREINILKVLNHPHIISLREVLESATKIYLIMEKCMTDLLRLSNDNNFKYCEDNVRRIVDDLTSAITYLHKNDIVHRDVKPENILVTDNPHNGQDHLYIKLSDFGLSIVKSGHGITNMMMLHDRCGTLHYMSPEILSEKAYSQQCDVWSIGVMIYFMLTRTLPFESKYEADLIKKICNDEPPLTKHNFSPELLDLLKRVLNKNPAARMTAGEMLNHPWLRGRKLIADQSHNVIDMMRLCNRDMRILSEEDDEALFGVAAADNRRSQAAVSVKNVTFEKKAKRASATKMNSFTSASKANHPSRDRIKKDSVNANDNGKRKPTGARIT